MYRCVFSQNSTDATYLGQICSKLFVLKIHYVLLSLCVVFQCHRSVLLLSGVNPLIRLCWLDGWCVTHSVISGCSQGYSRLSSLE